MDYEIATAVLVCAFPVGFLARLGVLAAESLADTIRLAWRLR